ncbi:MAG: hypothetical protein ACRENE_24465 [Polyangiaceae bacterium]
MENRFFFPQAALDQWIVDEKVELRDGEMSIIGAARHYRLSEAVHVVREVSGTTDRHDLVGRVKPLGALERLGAEIVESSMLLGDAAYDVEQGWVGTPVASSSPKAQSDDEILALLARSTQA